MALLEGVPDALLVLDRSSKILWSNAAAQRLFGRDAEDLKGSMFGWPTANGRDLQIEILTADRTVAVAMLRASKLDIDGTELTVASIRDDTVRHGVDERLSRTVARLRAAFESSTIPSALCSDAESVLMANEQFSRLTGYAEEELSGATFTELFEEASAPHHGSAVMTLMLASGETAKFEVRSTALESEAGEDLRLRELLPPNDEAIADPGEKTAPRAEDLLPRAAFRSEVERRIEECRRYGTEAGLLVVGPDPLLSVPSREALATSEQLIDKVVAAIRTRLRKSDLLGRVTGQSVGVIIPHATAGSVGPLAEAMVECVNELEASAGSEPLSVSVGAMVLHGDRPGATVAVEAAIQAMLEASRAGGGRHVMATRSS